MRSKFSFVWAFAAAMLVAGAAHGATPPTFTFGFGNVPADDETVATGTTKTFEIWATVKTENCLDPFGPGGWTMSIAVAKDAASTGSCTPKTINAKAAKGVIVDAYYIQDVNGDDPNNTSDNVTWPHFVDYLKADDPSTTKTGFDLGQTDKGGDAFWSIVQAATSDYTPLPPKNPPPAGLKGIVVAEVLGSTELKALQPTGTVTVVKFSVDVVAPCTVNLSFVDNLKGSGQPTPNSVTFSGKLSTAGSFDLSTPDYLKVTTASFKYGKETVAPKCEYANDFAFFFGPAVTANAYAVPSGQNDVKVGLRNKGTDGLGLSLGVQLAAGTMSFFDDPNPTPPAPSLDILFTKTDGHDVAVVKGNTATGIDAAATIDAVTIAGTIPTEAQGALFVVGMNAAKTQARIGYVSDGGNSGRIIAGTTDNATTGECGIQEVFNVKLTAGVQNVKFSRGDANADTKINVTDAVVIAQNIFANKLVFKNCKDMLDVDDNGKLEVNDPVSLLKYIFVPGTPAPDAPFRTCGQIAPKLGCTEANCQ